MARSFPTSRKVLALAPLVLVVGLAGSTGARADYKCSVMGCKSIGQLGYAKYGNYLKNKYGSKGYGWKSGFHHHGYGHGGLGWSFGAAALGGLAVGAIAASAAGTVEAGGCAIEQRRAVDEDGNAFVRRVRVCE